MASTNFRTFTITQARIGEPLHFQPALGSKELDGLVDAYVLGPATKQDKLSQVTLEFFNLAQVDIYTGLLTRHYSVAVSPSWTFDHLSPTQSHSSSDFSPPIFTPSPASSLTFADSGYASISMTPPTRNMGAPHRVVKKSAKKSAKRDANKAAEARLPGFSIMTKDGVDVTSSAAGRGTKTKEQREHAHLMRIMKACDECKRKKVRCDPSHRSSQPETSTSSTPTSSSGRPNPSPPVSAPPLSRTATQTSPVTSFDDNPIDDFVLFPDEASSSWNPADWSLPDFDENLDLSHFNFDINGLNDMSSPSFDFFDQPATGFQRDHSEPAASLGHPRDPCDLFTYQHGRGEWASSQDVNLSVTHPRALPTCPPESGQTDTSFFDTDFHESPISHTTPTSPVSSFAEHLLPSASVPQPQVAPTSSASRPSGELDWSLIDRSLIPDGDGSLSQSMNRRERRIFSRVERARKAAIQQRVDSVSSAYADESQSNSNSLIERHRPRSFRDSPLDSLLGQGSWNPGATSGGSLDYWDLENTVAIIAESMQVLKSVPGAYRPILQELQRLRNLLQLLKDWSACSERTPLLRQALVAELVILTSQLQVSVTCLKKRYNRLDPEFHPDFLRKSLRQTRQVISALFATINNLTAQDIGNGGSVAATNTSILSSGLRQGAVLPTNLTHYHPQDASVYLSDGSNFILSVGSFSALGSNKTHDIHENVNDTIPVGLDERIYQENDVLGAIPASNGIGSVTLAIVDTPRYRLVTRRAVEPFSRHVELDSANDVLPVVETCATLEPATALARQTVVPTPFGFDALNARRTASESFREHHKEDIAHVQNPTTNDLVVNISLIAAPHTLALQSPCRSQDVTRTPSLSFQSGGSPRSDSLRYSDSSSPGAIPGTALGNIARVNSGCTTSVILDTVSSGILVLASLVLMNYLQATAFNLAYALILLAIPRSTLSLIASMTLAVVVAQSMSLSMLMNGLKHLVALGIHQHRQGNLSAPFLQQASSDSVGGALSSFKRLSTGLMSCEDASLLSAFRELSYAQHMSAA